MKRFPESAWPPTPPPARIRAPRQAASPPSETAPSHTQPLPRNPRSLYLALPACRPPDTARAPTNVFPPRSNPFPLRAATSTQALPHHPPKLVPAVDESSLSPPRNSFALLPSARSAFKRSHR